MSVILKDALGTPTTLETLPPKGQAAMAGSLPVTIAIDQPAVPISAGAAGDTPPALATNASGIIGWLRKMVDTLATAAKQDAGNASLAAIAAAEISISAVSAIIPNDASTVAAGRHFAIVCTTAGNVKVTLSGGGTFTFPVAVGLTLMPWQVTQVWVTNTTAVASYANMS